MNANRVAIALIALLSLLSGTLSIVSATMYYRCVVQSCAPADDTRFTRGFIITSADLVAHEVIGMYATPTGTARFRFTIEDATRVTSRSPVVRDDVIMGYGPVKEETFDALKPGTAAFGRFSTDANGLYVASSIMLGDIIPR